MAFRIIRNDITKVAADVIVNSANPKPVCGGSTEALIYEAAGYDELLDARQGVGYLEIGQVGVTPAFKLQAQAIVHVSCPWWSDGAAESLELLRKCYAAVLQQAVALNAKSVAIPLLSSGVYRFPKDVALQIASEVCGSFNEFELDIILVVYDQQAFEKAKELFKDVEDQLKEEPDLSEPNMRLFSSMPAQSSAQPRPKKCSNKQVPISDEMLAEPPIFRGPACEEPRRANLPVKKKACAVKGLVDRTPPVSDIFGGYAKPKVAKPKAKSASDEDALHVKINAVLMGIGASDDDDATFQDKLEEYIKRIEVKPAEIYRAANLDRRLFSKLRTAAVPNPKKNTVIALAVGLRLNIRETEDFLNRVGYALSPANKSDMIVKCCIEDADFYKCKHAVWEPIQRLNDILQEYHEAPLGATLSDDDK